MNSLFLKLFLFLSLACLVVGYSFAGSNTSGISSESPYLVGKIDDINHAFDTIKFYGLNYHYTRSTLIVFHDQRKATEYNLVPGTRVRLLKKSASTPSEDNAFELSEIIIRENQSR